MTLQRDLLLALRVLQTCNLPGEGVIIEATLALLHLSDDVPELVLRNLGVLPFQHSAENKGLQEAGAVPVVLSKCSDKLLATA